MAGWLQDHRLEIEARADELLDEIEEAAEIWQADWHRHGTGGSLALPVDVGLKQGLLTGEITTTQKGDRVEVVYSVTDEQYRVRTPAAVVLLFGAAGGLLLVLVPLFPQLFKLVPAALLFSVAAWFLVASQIRTRGPQEFLALLEEYHQAPLADPETGAPIADDEA